MKQTDNRCFDPVRPVAEGFDAVFSEQIVDMARKLASTKLGEFIGHSGDPIRPPGLATKVFYSKSRYFKRQKSLEGGFKPPLLLSRVALVERRAHNFA